MKIGRIHNPVGWREGCISGIKHRLTIWAHHTTAIYKALHVHSAHNTQFFSLAQTNDRVKTCLDALRNITLLCHHGQWYIIFIHQRSFWVHFSLLISVIREEIHFVWFHIGAVPDVQKFLLRHIREHGQNASGWSEIKTDVHRLTLQ